MTDGWQKLLNQSGYELNLADITSYNKMVKKRKMEKEKKKYKYKGFAFARDGDDKFNTKLSECLKLRNTPIKKKADEAMKLMREGGLTFNIKKQHFFNESDLLVEMTDVYLKILRKHADTMPPKRR